MKVSLLISFIVLLIILCFVGWFFYKQTKQEVQFIQGGNNMNNKAKQEKIDQITRAGDEMYNENISSLFLKEGINEPSFLKENWKRRIFKLVNKKMKLIPCNAHIISTVFGYICRVENKLYLNNRHTSIQELRTKKKAIDKAGLIANSKLDQMFQNKMWNVVLSNVVEKDKSVTNKIIAYVLNSESAKVVGNENLIYIKYEGQNDFFYDLKLNEFEKIQYKGKFIYDLTVLHFTRNIVSDIFVCNEVPWSIELYNLEYSDLILNLTCPSLCLIDIPQKVTYEVNGINIKNYMWYDVVIIETPTLFMRKDEVLNNTYFFLLIEK
jgi:hypothetical protein